MASQELRIGWYTNLAGDYYFVWGTARDIFDTKRRVVFVPTSGDDACQILSLEVNKFRRYIVYNRFRHVEHAPRDLPPDFPTNLFVNKLA